MTREFAQVEIAGPAGSLRVHHAVSPSALATPVLFVHPINLQGRIWMEVCAALHGARTLILPDLRGHGASAPVGPFHVRDYVADCLAVLDHLRVEAVHVVGGSLGGAIACALAADHPRRVRSLAALGSGFYFGDAGLESVLDTLRELGPMGMFRQVFPKLTFGPKCDPRIIEYAVSIANPNTTDVVAEIWKGVVATDERASARRVDRPALVVTGEHDVTCSIAMGLDMARLLRTNLTVIPEIGHMPMLESPAAVASLLEAHWARVES